jgi:TPR repeat protein
VSELTSRRNSPGRSSWLFAASLAVALAFLLAGPSPAAHAQSATTQAVADPDALVRLGDLSYAGEVVPTDYAKAFDYYSQAAAAGSTAGKLRMGEMMARGQGTTADVDKGRAMVKEVADTGSATALVSLGDLYSRGDAGPMDEKIAIKAYDDAASRGNTTAMIRLGDIYLYGRFARADAKKALDYYQRAADASSPYGLYGVGKIYIDGLIRKTGSFDEGVKLLKQAASGGVPSAVIVISNSYFYSYRGRGGAKLALATLQDALNDGNLSAGRELVAAYRSGKRNGRLLLVRSNSKTAHSFFDSIKDKLGPAEVAYEEFMFDAVDARRPDYPALYDRLLKIPDSGRSALIRDLRTIKPTLYVYAAQQKMAELGLFKGTFNARLNGTTIRALRKLCTDVGTHYFCRHGPMSGEVAELLTYKF